MRLVYYSLSMPEDAVAGQRLAWQLGMSLRSLRRHNRTVPVRLYHFGALPGELTRIAAEHDIVVIDRGPYGAYIEQTGHPAHAALSLVPLLHKWLLLRELREVEMSQLLYCDCDTYFAGDVDCLFRDYSEHGLYAREEPFSRLSAVRDPVYLDEARLGQIAASEGVSQVPPFNTGVMLMNHGCWRNLADRSRGFLSTVWRFLCWFADNPAPVDLRAAAFLRGAGRPLRAADGAGALVFPSTNRWLVEEAAAWLTLGSIPNAQTGLFSKQHVVQNGEYLHARAARNTVNPRAGAARDDWIVCHYFGVRMDLFQVWLDRAREQP